MSTLTNLKSYGWHGRILDCSDTNFFGSNWYENINYGVELKTENAKILFLFETGKNSSPKSWVQVRSVILIKANKLQWLVFFWCMDKLKIWLFVGIRIRSKMLLNPRLWVIVTTCHVPSHHPLHYNSVEDKPPPTRMYSIQEVCAICMQIVFML